MKACEIKEGGVYRNRGKGKTARRVIAIGNEHKPDHWFSDSPPPNEPGVLYADQKGRHERLYLSSFAAWSGSEL